MDKVICNRKSGAEPITVRNCGLMAYREALELQLELCEKRHEGPGGNTVLIVEHPDVITLGARKSENKLLTDCESLGKRGIDVVEVRRGGGCTAHNPGQLVVYPIVKLKSLGLGINEYVRRLEAIGIELLEGYGVASGRRNGYPGLWVGEEKIASIGVQVKKGVTIHGMAINICNDLSIFDNIVPCGIEGVRITSLGEQTGGDILMDEVKRKAEKIIIRHLSGDGQGAGGYE